MGSHSLNNSGHFLPRSWLLGILISCYSEYTLFLLELYRTLCPFPFPRVQMGIIHWLSVLIAKWHCASALEPQIFLHRVNETQYGFKPVFENLYLFVSFSCLLDVFACDIYFCSLCKLFLFYLNKIFWAFSFQKTYVVIGSDPKNKFSRKNLKFLHEQSR